MISGVAALAVSILVLILRTTFGDEEGGDEKEDEIIA